MEEVFMETDYKSKVTMDPSGFVLLADYVPSIVQEIRYYSTYNFIGDKIDGYEQPCAIITKEAARALKTVSNELNVQGYRMKVFDCYRPACAVVKQELFSKGYVASKSSHSRGSTIDLTLLDMKTGKEVDMGSPFDMFSEVSHPGYRGITDEQYNNRMILRNSMLRNGFEPIDCEWWHFTLKDEPYPDTYFEFPVSADYLLKGR